jgi:SPP1 family predicted phage head-tail adaptor
MGVQTKEYPTTGETIFCSFRTFGGTEINNNGVLTVEDTATIETWFNPDITADCRLQDVNGKQYEIMGTPENISMRNQFMFVKLKAIKGGA